MPKTGASLTNGSVIVFIFSLSYKVIG